MLPRKFTRRVKKLLEMAVEDYKVMELMVINIKVMEYIRLIEFYRKIFQ